MKMKFALKFICTSNQMSIIKQYRRTYSENKPPQLGFCFSSEAVLS